MSGAKDNPLLPGMWTVEDVQFSKNGIFDSPKKTFSNNGRMKGLWDRISVPWCPRVLTSDPGVKPSSSTEVNFFPRKIFLPDFYRNNDAVEERVAVLYYPTSHLGSHTV